MHENPATRMKLEPRHGRARFLRVLFLTIVAWLASGALTAGAQSYYEPPRGSAERKAIMDAARGPVSAELGATVIFVVDVLRTDGNAAYLQAIPINPDSTPLDWTQTPFRQDWLADTMSDVVMVLLNRVGSTWQVVDYIIGPTDVAWYEWIDRYGLPEALFRGG